MSGSYIETVKLLVEIQANGIIRRVDTGYLIGRLSDDYEYEQLKNSLEDSADIPPCEGSE